jgi:hypothetical protein
VKTAVLIGTRHDYQRPGTYGAAEFYDFVSDTCERHYIALVGEEMSLDALGLYGATESVCKQVADDLHIQHCCCDPSSEEQKRLGIPHPGKSDASAFSAVRDPRHIDPEVSAADALRERCWLESLLTLDFWPVLFVCGSPHTEPFRTLLEANGVVVHVLSGNWSPN